MRTARSGLISTMLVIGLAVGMTSGALAQEDEVAALTNPVQFTGSIECGPEVRSGTEEAGADDEAVSHRSRGHAWQQPVTMSDPRLEGAHYLSEDTDQYLVDVGDGILRIAEVTSLARRIENDEGAWQGSAVHLYTTDGTAPTFTMLLLGEGAYEGLTAIWEEHHDHRLCAGEVRGLIIEGEVPAPAEAYATE